MFGRRALGHREGRLADRLHGISIDPERAKEEWLRYQLKSGGAGRPARRQPHLPVPHRRRAGGGRARDDRQGLGPGPARAPRGRHAPLRPGDRGRAGHRPRRRAAARAADLRPDRARRARSPSQAGRIHDFLADPASTGVVAVALPEEMPVNETIDLRAALRADMGMELDAVVVNALLPERFADKEAARLAKLDGRLPEAAAAAVAAALAEHSRAAEQREEVERLRAALDAPVVEPSLPVRARARARGARAAERRAGGGAVIDELARAQGGLHLRRLGRRGQDHHLGGDRARHGGARQEGGGADDRPGPAAGQRARAARARQRGARV